MPLIRLISQSFRFCNFGLPNLNTKTRMWFGWEERHEQQTRYHFPFSLNPFRADSEANGTELSLHQPRFVGKAAAGDFFPNLKKFYFSFGVGCFFFFFYRKMSAGTENVHIRNARAHLSRRLRRFVVRFARFALGWRSHRPAPEENFSIWKISSKPSPTRGTWCSSETTNVKFEEQVTALPFDWGVKLNLWCASPWWSLVASNDQL